MSQLKPFVIATCLALSFSLVCPALSITPESYQAYQQARQLIQQDNPEGAEKALRQAIAFDPNDVLNYEKLAAVMMQMNRPNEAISLYKHALALDSHDFMIHMALGEAFEQLGQYDQAQTEYAQGLIKNPAYAFGYFALGRSQMQLHHDIDAIASLQQFLKSYPDHYEGRRLLAQTYLENQQPAEAVQQYGLLKIRFASQFNDHLNFARALIQAHDPQNALEELKTAYATDGNKGDILEELGHAHQALGQTDLALLNYQKAITADPKRYDLLMDMASLYQQQKKPKDAIKACQQFLVQEPDNVPARHQLANLYLGQKQYEPALKEYNTLLSKTTDPSDRFQLEKEIAYTQQSKGNLKLAIGQYETLLKSIESNPEQLSREFQMRLNLALAYHQNSQLEKASKLYATLYNELSKQLASQPINQPDPQKTAQMASIANDLASALLTLGNQAYQNKNYQDAVIRFGDAARFSTDSVNGSPNPHLIAAYQGLGNAYYSLNLYPQAKSAYEEVLKRDPDNTDAKLYTAKLQLQEQDPKDSIPALKKLAEDNPNSQEILLSLGEAYVSLGDPAQAVLVYQKAIDLAQKQPASNEDKERLYLTEGTLWQQMKEFAKAKDAYNQALLNNPTNAQTYYNLGIVNNELGTLDDSVSSYQKALSLDPAMADSLYGMAVTYEKQKKYSDALKTYQHYISLSKPANAPPRATSAGNQEAPATSTLSYLKQAQDRLVILQKAFPSKGPGNPKPEVQAGHHTSQHSATTQTSNTTAKATKKTDPPVNTLATQENSGKPAPKMVKPDLAIPLRQPHHNGISN